MAKKPPERTKINCDRISISHNTNKSKVGGEIEPESGKEWHFIQFSMEHLFIRGVVELKQRQSLENNGNN